MDWNTPKNWQVKEIRGDEISFNELDSDTATCVSYSRGTAGSHAAGIVRTSRKKEADAMHSIGTERIRRKATSGECYLGWGSHKLFHIFYHSNKSERLSSPDIDGQQRRLAAPGTVPRPNKS